MQHDLFRSGRDLDLKVTLAGSRHRGIDAIPPPLRFLLWHRQPWMHLAEILHSLLCNLFPHPLKISCFYHVRLLTYDVLLEVMFSENRRKCRPSAYDSTCILSDVFLPIGRSITGIQWLHLSVAVVSDLMKSHGQTSRSPVEVKSRSKVSRINCRHKIIGFSATILHHFISSWVDKLWDVMFTKLGQGQRQLEVTKGHQFQNMFINHVTHGLWLISFVEFNGEGFDI